MPCRSIAVITAWMALSACQPDLAHHPISLHFPGNGGPTSGAPANCAPGNCSSSANGHSANGPGPIEAGKPLPLSPRQQEAVVAGVTRWLKDSSSAQFGEMRASRNSRGHVTVCGTVDGRNTAGRLVGLSPFVGVLQGTAVAPVFVLVEIGTAAADRAVVASICRDSGISGIG